MLAKKKLTTTTTQITIKTVRFDMPSQQMFAGYENPKKKNRDADENLQFSDKPVPAINVDSSYRYNSLTANLFLLPIVHCILAHLSVQIIPETNRNVARGTQPRRGNRGKSTGSKPITAFPYSIPCTRPADLRFTFTAVAALSLAHTRHPSVATPPPPERLHAQNVCARARAAE